jgi:rfaE bifunctional protein nucleotidyltransferase chain/domain
MTNIKQLEELKIIRQQLKAEGKIVVFTNGVFDLIHAGHIDYLKKAKSLGDILMLGLNSDESVKLIKGDKRPILKELERAFIVANLKPVDYVVIFDEDTPARVIERLIPDVLVKGADWTLENIVGREIVEEHGGVVKSIEFVNDQSTSKIIESIVAKYCK